MEAQNLIIDNRETREIKDFIPELLVEIIKKFNNIQRIIHHTYNKYELMDSSFFYNSKYYENAFKNFTINLISMRQRIKFEITYLEDFKKVGQEVLDEIKEDLDALIDNIKKFLRENTKIGGQDDRRKK